MVEPVSRNRDRSLRAELTPRLLSCARHGMHIPPLETFRPALGMSDPTSKSNLNTSTEAPLDLTAYLNPQTDADGMAQAEAAPSESVFPAIVPAEMLAPMAPLTRLVDLSSLPAQQRAIAEERANGIRFDDATSTLTFVDNALQPLATASRRLLSETTLSFLIGGKGVVKLMVDDYLLEKRIVMLIKDDETDTLQVAT